MIPGTVRAFLAIDLSAPPELERLAGRLPAHFHLTLRFFEELPEGEAERVGAALRTAASGTTPYPLELRSIGAFPNPRNPRVIWVGLGRGRSETTALADRIGELLAGAGFPPDERPFEPHATVARVRDPRDRARALRILEEGKDRSFGEQTVQELVGYSSRLSPSGAVHEKLFVAPLGGGGPG